MLAPTSAGRISITWHEVPCDVTGRRLQLPDGREPVLRRDPDPQQPLSGADARGEAGQCVHDAREADVQLLRREQRSRRRPVRFARHRRARPGDRGYRHPARRRRYDRERLEPVSGAARATDDWTRGGPSICSEQRVHAAAIAGGEPADERRQLLAYAARAAVGQCSAGAREKDVDGAAIIGVRRTLEQPALLGGSTSPPIVDFSSPRSSASAVMRSLRSRRIASTRSCVSDRSWSAPTLLSTAIVANDTWTSASISGSGFIRGVY